MVTPANTVLFEEFCNTLECIFKKKQKRDREKILVEFICDLKTRIRQTEGEKNTTLYPVIRLLVPKLERERPPYNMKERKLGELLVKILPLRKDSQEAKKLLNDRSVLRDRDFASEVYFVVKKRMNERTGNLTIKDINDILDKIATAEVGNKGPILDQAFSSALRNLNADQLKWFIRIILKNLKLGLSDKGILACFHPDAPEYYDNCHDITQVCLDLDDACYRPENMGIKLLSPVSPMLCERLDVTDVCYLDPDRTYQVEEKFDGERSQIHMKDGKFIYFTRRAHVVKIYGDNYEEGLLTRYLKGCFKSDVTSFILDGEMMLWHKQDQCFGPKGLPYDVKKITEKSAYRPCFCAYDLLYLNGKSLVGPAENGGTPLNKRLEQLDSLFTDIPGVIQHSKRKIVEKRTDILEELNTSMLNQEEGIVVKDVQSYYRPGHRNLGWFKLKMEYTKGAMPDLDLVIIGADRSGNKRQGQVKSFFVACLDNSQSEKRWLCVGCVASGLKSVDRDKVVTHLERHWHRTAFTPPQGNLIFNKARPDYWIAPEHSIVLEICASELTKTSTFATDYTLRFSRIIRTREDKPIDDTMTLEEFCRPTLNQGHVVKLATKRINQDQLANNEDKIPKKRVVKEKQVAEPYRVASHGDVKVTSNALAGRKLCILSDDEDCGRTELIKIVETHGGKVVADYGADTWCCVAGRSTARVRAAVTSRSVDVARAAWLRALLYYYIIKLKSLFVCLNA
ncbi:hypothetical protein O3G_MSEX010712 [Manduca sexta]|uniref:DNA ligase 4 n=1 Tax=Manduca sexta TaxID=7130 RepID=A0A922CTU8_MANSE|nr:hypothetical protein O3G_MSEX010712 [Manduca sexta]KAG6458135.1 hypothetical protein O3G_MSEX010712 [Manduca sexta]